jgi:DNA-binding NtrC family response regulator
METTPVIPARLSANVFLELPPVLAHYLEGGRNLWLDSLPGEGRLTFLNRPGQFADLEALAVQRRHLITVLGRERARALEFRIGFEQGRRDAVRHLKVFEGNVRLALQAGPVFAQAQGRYVSELLRFEYDLPGRTLIRELRCSGCVEARAHGLAKGIGPGCWSTAGYLSGHTGELLQRRVLTLETSCASQGGDACLFVSRLANEWGDEIRWMTDALEMNGVEDELDRLRAEVEEARSDARAARAALGHARRRLSPDDALSGITAGSDAMAQAVRRVRQIMETDLPVLLRGEYGSGRSTLARAIHQGSGRRSGPLGAVSAHQGALARAHRGTLYLDEVAALDLEAQAALLRALQKREVVPLGGGEPEKADVRLVAATQQDLEAQEDSGRFMPELRYALQGGAIRIPPLRERGEDLLRLAEAFLSEAASKYGRDALQLDDETRAALMRYAWPGNVHELRGAIEHAVLFAHDNLLRISDLPENILLAGGGAGPPRSLSAGMVEAALRRTGGNRTHAAEMLGIGRTTLWRLMKQYGIDQAGPEASRAGRPRQANDASA